MASVPMASHSASKVHKHVQQHYKNEEKENVDSKSKNPFRNSAFAMGNDIVPPNYNSKLMNSIWGMYNQYAAHAFQKNNEGSMNAIYHVTFPQAKTFSLWDSLRPRF